MNALAEFVTKSGMRQAELAAQAKCSRSLISMVLRGSRYPSPALAVRISRITGVPLASLVSPANQRILAEIQEAA
jgi:transcriptional regulator with XRE-family HTH domain